MTTSDPSNGAGDAQSALSRRLRYRIALMLAVVGALYACIPWVAAQLGVRAASTQTIGGLAAQMLLALVGAGLAGLLTASGYGRAGGGGWVRLALTAPVTTVLGGALGGVAFLLAGIVLGIANGDPIAFSSLSGTVELAFIFAVFGAVSVWNLASQTIVLVPIWVATMVCVHVLARRWRSHDRGAPSGPAGQQYRTGRNANQ